MGYGGREVQQVTIQPSQGMIVLFMGGDWNVCHTRVDWDCFTPYQWVMLFILQDCMAIY